MTVPRPDFYAALGVAPDATAEEITHAYRRLVRQYHPDTREGRAGETASNAALAQVIAAYAVLRDPERRAEYDRRRRAAQRPRPAQPTRWVPPRSGAPPAEPPIRAGPVRWRRPR